MRRLGELALIAVISALACAATVGVVFVLGKVIR